MNKKMTITIFLIFSLLSSVLSFQIKAIINEEIDEDIRLKYTISSPILIEHDDNFSDYPVLGDGSITTPWIIQNLNITNPGGYGISISGVNSYFEIRDCYILADDPIILNNVLSPVSAVINNTLENIFAAGYGLYINNTDDVVVQENYFSRCAVGIYIDSANNIKVERNHFNENGDTITGGHITDSSFEFNTFDNNHRLYIQNSDYLEFFNNTFLDNTFGLRLNYVDNLEISGNIFIDNYDYAIELITGCSGVVYDNFFIRNGLFYVSQVYDDSHIVDTEWYLGTVGNFWYDLGEKVVYPIGGGNNFYDLYPVYNSDDDNLNDYEERKVYLTDRYDEDTDDDLMYDDYEVENNLDPNLDDASDDADSDLLLNLDEMYHGTDPWDTDTDDDLLNDYNEVIWGLNPLTPNTNTDSDGDGLLDLEEALLGTLPNNDDSDSDGMNDKWEVDNSLDPLTNDAYADPDDDLLNNFLEFIYDCDPNLNDTDGDTHIDGWEIVHSTDPNDPTDYPSESFETAITETSISFVYVILSLIAISCMFIFRRKRR